MCRSGTNRQRVNPGERGQAESLLQPVKNIWPQTPQAIPETYQGIHLRCGDVCGGMLLRTTEKLLIPRDVPSHHREPLTLEGAMCPNVMQEEASPKDQEDEQQPGPGEASALHLAQQLLEGRENEALPLCGSQSQRSSHSAALAAAHNTHPWLPSRNQSHLPSSWEDGQKPATSVPSMSGTHTHGRPQPGMCWWQERPTTTPAQNQNLVAGCHNTPITLSQASPCRQRRRQPHPGRCWKLLPPAPRSSLRRSELFPAATDAPWGEQEPCHGTQHPELPAPCPRKTRGRIGRSIKDMQDRSGCGKPAVTNMISPLTESHLWQVLERALGII